jgi:nucleoside-diphosphate-sugar epimerase
MKKVLITGATGFIGRHCLPPLAARGYEIHAISSKDASPVDEGNLTWHRVDLLKREQVFEVMSAAQPTHLLHLAWYAVPGKYWTSTENFRWVQASLDLFEAFASVGGKRVVAAGSCAEYEWGGDKPCSETETPLKPATVYGACKHAVRIMLEAYAAQANLSAAWGRIFFLYGPHEYPSRLVASVIRSLLQNEAARCSHSQQVRDFLYVADVAEAFVALLERQVTGAVNIASGQAVLLQDVIYKIADRLGKRDLVQLGAIASPSNDPPLLVADTTRLNNEVGWKPRRRLEEGLDETIAWWKQQVEEGDEAEID